MDPLGLSPVPWLEAEEQVGEDESSGIGLGLEPQWPHSESGDLGSSHPLVTEL